MIEVFWATLEKVAMLLLFIGTGYLLRRKQALPQDAVKVLSKLMTLLFCPAYTMKNLSQSVTPDNIGSKLPLVLYGLLTVLLAWGLAWVLARWFRRRKEEMPSLIYAFAIPNFGYFAYPVIEGVFGSAVLADVMIFCIPMTVVTNTLGYALFMGKEQLSVKGLLTNPVVLSVFLGLALGLSGLQLPGVLMDVISGAGNCMSPTSMLLAGLVLGVYPLSQLLKGLRPYLISLIRLLGIPALFGAVLFLLGLREHWLLYPLLILGMPVGLNLVVFPESLGQDSSENARLCFVSNLLAVLVLPVTFPIATWLASLT